MTLLRSLNVWGRFTPPVKTGGYTAHQWCARCAPMELTDTQRPRFPDRTLGRETFKAPAAVDMGGEQGGML